MTARWLRVFVKLTLEERIVYMAVLGFWFAILALLALVSSGRWP
jgi:uncharacterized membrane protein